MGNMSTIRYWTQRVGKRDRPVEKGDSLSPGA